MSTKKTKQGGAKTPQKRANQLPVKRAAATTTKQSKRLPVQQPPASTVETDDKGNLVVTDAPATVHAGMKAVMKVKRQRSRRPQRTVTDIEALKKAGIEIEHLGTAFTVQQDNGPKWTFEGNYSDALAKYNLRSDMPDFVDWCIRNFKKIAVTPVA